MKDLKESGLPNWAKTPDSKLESKPPGSAIIEEEALVKKEPYSKRRDSSESTNGKRKDSGGGGEAKQKVEAKTQIQTPVKAIATTKKTPAKDKTIEKSPLKSPQKEKTQEKPRLKTPQSPAKVASPGSAKVANPGSVKVASPGSPAKQRRGMVRSESAQVF